MPYTIQTKDGIIIRDIPDDVAPDSEQLKARVAALRAGGKTQTPETTTAGMIAGIGRGASPTLAGAALGAGAGAMLGGVGAIPGAAAGAVAGTLAPMVGDPVVSLINRVAGTRFGLPSQAIQDLLTRAGVPLPDTAPERIAQSVGGALGGTGAGVQMGKMLMQSAGPVTRGVGGMLAANPAAQNMAAIGGGAGGQAASEAGATGPLQLAAALAGGLAGGAAGGAMTTTRAVKPQLPQIIADAEAQKIPLMTSDVAPPTTFMAKTLQIAGERIPFAGTGSVRAQQQEARIAAVQRMVDEYSANMQGSSEALMADFARKRGEQVSKYVALKDEVAAKHADSIVPVPRVTQAIDAELRKLAEMNNPDALKIGNVLAEFRESMQGQTFRGLEGNRGLLGDRFNDPGLAGVAGMAEKAIKRIYGPLKEDVHAYLKTQDPKDATKWMVANKRLSDMVGELDKTAFKQALDKGNVTPEAINSMLFSQKKSDVQQLYRTLSPRGREIARASIIQKAAGDMDNISPDKFSREVKRLGESVGVMFNGNELDRVEGLARVLDATKRASQAAVQTNSGQQTYGFAGGALLADLLGGAGGATAGAASIGGFARAYESAAVRNLLLRLRNTPKNSTQESATIRALMPLFTTQTEETP